MVTGSIYQFRVLATNDVGDSLPSDKLIDIMAAQLPSPPIDLVQIYSTGTTMAFEWQEPEDIGGTTIIDYEIYWDSGSEGSNFEMLQTSTLGMKVYYL